jgi:hypothetical protein
MEAQKIENKKGVKRCYGFGKNFIRDRICT